jgi:hypothetical protein
VLDEAARRALEEHWGARLAGEVGVREEFERAMGVYTAWLRERKGERR